jgi:hypothetical protein
MITLIILGYILTVQQVPTIIWGLFWISAALHFIKTVIDLVKLFMERM